MFGSGWVHADSAECNLMSKKRRVKNKLDLVLIGASNVVFVKRVGVE